MDVSTIAVDAKALASGILAYAKQTLKFKAPYTLNPLFAETSANIGTEIVKQDFTDSEQCKAKAALRDLACEGLLEVGQSFGVSQMYTDRFYSGLHVFWKLP